MPKERNSHLRGPEIPGPKVWIDLNRKSETKVIEFINNLEERTKFCKRYVAYCKEVLGKPSRNPEFAPKAPSTTTRRSSAGRRSIKKTSPTKPVSVRKTKNAARASTRKKSGSKVAAPPPTSNVGQRVSEEDTPFVCADVNDPSHPVEIFETLEAARPVSEEDVREAEKSLTIHPNEAPLEVHENVCLDDMEDAEEISSVEAEVDDISQPEEVVEAVQDVRPVSQEDGSEADQSLTTYSNEAFKNICVDDMEDVEEIPVEAENYYISEKVFEATEAARPVSQEDDSEADQTLTFEPVEAEEDDSSRPVEVFEAVEAARSMSHEADGDADQSLTSHTKEVDVCDEEERPDENDELSPLASCDTSLPSLVLSPSTPGYVDNPVDNPVEKATLADRAKEADIGGHIVVCGADVIHEPSNGDGSIVNATFNITDLVNETFDIAATSPDEAAIASQDLLVDDDPNLTNTVVADSDADVESEADDVHRSALKSKSLRKSRSLSLQQKRNLANSTESDSDTAAPASKNRKVEKPPVSTRLTRTMDRAVKASSQSSDTGRSTRSKAKTHHAQTKSEQNHSSHKKAVVTARVTRSKSATQSSTEETSESSQTAAVTLAPPRVSARGGRFRRSRSSIAASLLKVSAAKRTSIAELLVSQEVVILKPATQSVLDTPSPILPKSGAVAKTSATPSSNSLNNSRVHTGKVVRPNRKVFASGGRGISPAVGPRSDGVGVSGGSQGGVKSKSRMGIIQRSGQKSSTVARTPSNMVGRGGVTSFISKPKGNALDDVRQQKEMELVRKEEKEEEAKKRRDELLKKKADDQKDKREARIKRVQEARKKQEDTKDAKKYEKEKVDKLEALKKREEKAKAEKRKLENVEANKRMEREKMLEEQNKAVEADREREVEEQRVIDEKRVLAEKEREAEASLAKKVTQAMLVQQEQLNSTYSKPGDSNDTTIEVSMGVSSYDMTPARHELPPEPSKDEDNYGLDDLNSGEDTDDEDCPRKVVPKWAEGTQLRTALLKQCYMGPDLDLIFANVEMPDLGTMFEQQRKRFYKRTSSAVWGTPPESFKHASKRR
eukprot:GFUD01089184.1.p1 GENE.GFUD01089184.1~~GFUD01089184.1.p1  ORF type:complete len:1067 (-),score=272.61 GFUD01089184.1:119-3319(-)